MKAFFDLRVGYGSELRDEELAPPNEESYVFGKDAFGDAEGEEEVVKTAREFPYGCT